jgi:ADP-heptose:LPS heptosyltransferase
VADRVLVISLQGVGNLIMATPVIEGLARAGRDVCVAVSTRAAADLVAASPWVSATTSLDAAAPYVTRGGRAAGLGLRLRKERFAVSVTTYPNGRPAAILALAAGARVRVGFAERPAKGVAYTMRLAPVTGLHDVEQNLRLLDALEVQRPGVVAPWVPLSDGDRAFADGFISTAWPDAGRVVAALHPGGAATGLFRRWPRENFEELAGRLGRDLGLGVVLVGDASERTALESIARAAGGAVAVAAGQPLSRVAAVIAKCSVFVGNDSGPLHIAAALGVPVVGIYGPTNEVRTAPYGAGHTVLTASVACRPCYAFGERFSCEFDQVMCLELIDVDVVLEAVKAKLGQAV